MKTNILAVALPAFSGMAVVAANLLMGNPSTAPSTRPANTEGPLHPVPFGGNGRTLLYDKPIYNLLPSSELSSELVEILGRDYLSQARVQADLSYFTDDFRRILVGTQLKELYKFKSETGIWVDGFTSSHKQAATCRVVGRDAYQTSGTISLFTPESAVEIDYVLTLEPTVSSLTRGFTVPVRGEVAWSKPRKIKTKVVKREPSVPGLIGPSTRPESL